MRRDQKARRARCRRDQKVLFHQRRVWSWDGFLRRVSVEGGGAGVARDARAARGEPATRRADRPGRVARRIRDRRAARSVRIRGVNFPRARVRRGVAGTSALSVRRWVSGARTSAAFDGWILSNSTTRPPLSPVARCSPVLSNSTALIMSAAFAIGDWDEASGQRPRVGYRGLRGKSDIVDACRVAGVAVDVRALVLTVLHLLSRRALAEHLAKVPIELPEGLARGCHRSPSAALSHSLSSPGHPSRGSLLSGCCASEGLLFPGDRTTP